MPATTTTPTLWVDANGRIACTVHGGGYLAAAAPKNPPPDTLVETPLTSWLAVPVDDLDGLGCEGCESGLVA